MPSMSEDLRPSAALRRWGLVRLRTQLGGATLHAAGIVVRHPRLPAGELGFTSPVSEIGPDRLSRLTEIA
jgi:hypothetical protein